MDSHSQKGKFAFDINFDETNCPCIVCLALKGIKIHNLL